MLTGQTKKNFNHKVTKKYSLESGDDYHVKSGKGVAIEAGMASHIKAGMNLVLEAGMQVSIKAGPSFISIGPAGIDISGPMVKINSGGSAGSGSGSSPSSPSDPAETIEPTPPKEADDDKSGDASAKAKAKSVEAKKLALGSNSASAYIPAVAASAGVAAVQAIAATEEQPEQVTCTIESLKVKCGHSGRSEDLPFNILEVVPSTTAQKSTEIALKLDGSSGLSAPEQSGADSAGAWGDGVSKAADKSKGLPANKKVSSASYTKITKFGGTETISATLKIKEDCGTGKLKLSGHGDWKNGNASSYTLDAMTIAPDTKLADVSPESFDLSSACEHHSGKTVIIKSYPSEQVSAEVSLGFISEKMDKYNKAWETWGQKFMGLLPLDLKPRLIPPKGSLSYEKGWKESDDWRAYYYVAYKASLEPICGIEIEVVFSVTKLVGTAVGIPPILSSFLSEHVIDILMQLGAGVELKCSGDIENKYFSTGDTLSKGTISLGVEGKVWLGLTARAGSQYIASVSVSGRCEVKPYGGGNITTDKEGVFVDIEVKLPPPILSIKVEYRAFVVFSRTTNKSKVWNVWKEEDCKVQSDKYQLI